MWCGCMHCKALYLGVKKSILNGEMLTKNGNTLVGADELKSFQVLVQ